MPKKGEKMSEEQKECLRKPRSDETRQKIRVARMNQNIPRKNTSIELLLQKELDLNNIKYKKHIPVCGICFPDISFPKKQIVVFADGDYWHNIPSTIERDNLQNKVLNQNGWKVLRFWEHEINESVEKCVDQIIECL